MIRKILERLWPKPQSFPERDRQALFERRAFRVNNRKPEQAAIMVRKLTILAEGRK